MSVAVSYAKALFEVSRSTELAQGREQIRSFSALLDQSKELRVALLGPATSAKEKNAVVEEISQRTGFNPLVRKFLGLLARKGRLAILKDILSALDRVRLEAEGGILAQAVSADPMTQKDVQELAEAFGKKLGKKVEFEVSTDPTLLAGLKITVNGVTYDGTLRSQLEQMKEQIVFGASVSSNSTH